jgi:diguanylate cyclase (GGDEF)-like protein/PAS domain S-box-containing protein
MVVDPSAQLFWLDVTYFGVVVAPTAFLVLAIEFTDRVHSLSTRIRAGLSIIPLLTILILWTDPWHGLFYNGLRTGDAILNGGVWFWIFIIYTYLILLLASIIIIQKIIRERLIFQVQAALLLIGMILPWAGNILSMIGFMPFPGLDLTPFLFTLSGLCFMVAFFRFGLLDIKPIAQSQLMKNLLDGVIILDKTNRIVDYNPEAEKIFDLSLGVIGKTFSEATAQFKRLTPLEGLQIEKTRIQIKSEENSEFEVRILPLLDDKKQLTGNLITVHDITEYQQAQEKLRQSEARYRLLFDNAVESILVVQDRNIVFCNPVTSEITGYSMDEIINDSFVKLIYPEDIEIVLENYRRRVDGVELQGRYQFRLVRKDLSLRWVETSGIRIDWQGEMATLHFLMDLTERKKAEVALEFRSTHDFLTGLYNRQYFELEMEKLQNSRRQPVSILALDMNGLKEINDNQGHAAGDELLIVSAEVIRKAFRPEDIVARMGGDEFFVILPETNKETAQKIVERVKQVINEYNQLYPNQNPINFSMGFASNETTKNLREVMRMADREMYKNKEAYYGSL